MKVMPLDDPIVVTGMGALGAGAANPAELYAAALRGRSPAEWMNLEGISDSIAVSRAPDPVLPSPELRYARRLDRSAHLALAAARQAIATARLGDGIDQGEVGVVIGSSRGPIERTVASTLDAAWSQMSPTTSAETTPASLSGMIAQAYGFGASISMVSATCASAAAAINIAALQLAMGEAQAVVVGGAEAPLIPLLAAQLRAARVMGWDEDPALTCRPFDVSRNGLMMGEGAAVLVLERA